MKSGAQRACRMLYFYRGSKSDHLPPFARLLEARGWKIDPVPVSDDAAAYGVWDVLRYARSFSSYDVVAANEYFLTWAICLRLIGASQKPKVAAISFNQSRRLLLTGFKPIDRLLNRIWRPVAMFIVHSRAEAQLFEKLHDIPAQRFVFCHWGFDLPPREAQDVRLPAVPYVSMVGRNNRDIATFCAAVESAGVCGVIITARYMLDRYSGKVPANIRILTDRPMGECLAYIEGSLAHLVLVLDGQRGAGHISAVSAMHLGRPQVFSDIAPLRDYLEDQVNGIAVGLGDVEGVAKAIRTLQNDPIYAQNLGSNGRKFALQTLSNQVVSRHAADAFSALACNPNETDRG